MTRINRRRRSGSDSIGSMAASAWFAEVENAGSVFVSGAKDAYVEFFESEFANGNLPALSNGMFLSYAGFTGLGGCFVPLISRDGVLPTNVGFVSGNKGVNYLKGTASAAINCNIGVVPSQQNNLAFGYRCSSLTLLGASTEICHGNGVLAGNRAAPIDDTYVRGGGPTLLTYTPQRNGLFFINRSNGTGITSYFNEDTPIVEASASGVPTETNTFFFARPPSGTFPSDRETNFHFFGDALPYPLEFRNALVLLMSRLAIL